ncbi:uncharacterized protein LOC117176484 [Belonocnema kinseyi]|uniref:uncharacterized protein LOC117176484 n=1 Tax=Belonocnema kinseyi TaxID=2817044 RepID=UPI00143D581C|nr:uncharacterized protein LOC117176484 [Belonocnema kinseyi]
MQCRARPKAVLNKLAEGMSYAEVLKDLKQKVKPEVLGVKIRGVRQTRNGEVLVELGPASENRATFSAAIIEAVGERGKVSELVPHVEVEVLDLYTTTDAAEFEEAGRSHFNRSYVGDVKVSLTKRYFRGNLRVFVELTEALTGRLSRAGHLKVGWVSCRVEKKIERVHCYHRLHVGHIAAHCEGPDRTKACWRCGKEGHRAAACESTPQCYLCADKEGNHRTDHQSGTMRCSMCREAASSKKPPGRPR